MYISIYSVMGIYLLFMISDHDRDLFIVDQNSDDHDPVFIVYCCDHDQDHYSNSI